MNFSPALRRLLKHLETRCTAGCCRSRAFELEAPRILSWLRSEPETRRAELLSELASLLGSFRDHGDTIVVEARGLESTWPVVEFTSFLALLRLSIERTASSA